MSRSTLLTLLAVLAWLAAACGGEDSGSATTSSVTVDADADADADTDESGSDGTGGSTSTTADPSEDASGGAEDGTDSGTEAETETGADGESDRLPDEIERVDWLTIASGVTLASFDAELTSASDAVRAIDGAPNQIGFGSAADDPFVYVFELPAPTVFDRFAVPDTTNSPGNTTFFQNIEIAGSATSATDGFEVLVDEEFVDLPADQPMAEFTPLVQDPVRFIRLTLSGGLVVEEEHGADRTITRFSELIGNGTQESVPLEVGFDGVWELTFADNPDGSGDPTELRQEGAQVVGCIGFAEVSGTVTGNVVRLNGIDTRNERPSAYLLVIDDDGRLRGMESTNNGVFRARIGRVAPDGTITDCTQTVPEPLACGAIAYVNFDLDSAEIRPDSAQVLDDLFDGLSTIADRDVMIVGHTSTEGPTDYNQGLSERRAASVLDALVDRGLPPDQISAVGKGETEPLVSEGDEASRALNRRVEIVCP